MDEDRQAERRFGDEYVACPRLERRAGWIGAALIVARDDDPLARMVEHDLRGTEHMAGGDEAHRDVAHAHLFAIGDRVRRLRAIAGVHDRERLSRCPDGAVPAAGMIAMAVGDKRAGLGLRRIDPGIGGGDVDALGMRLDPGAELGHSGAMGSGAAGVREARKPPISAATVFTA